MSSYVLVGIDSGGTRTNVELVAANGSDTRYSYESSYTLSGTLPPSKYPEILRRILAPGETFFVDNDLSDSPTFIFISAAGFAQPTRDDFMSAMGEVLPTVFGGMVAAAGAANDTVTLLIGHEADAAIIAGTGSNVVVRASDGRLYQAGGHGWVACDQGSGFWIGLRATRQACRDFESGEDTVLLQRFRHLYGIRVDDDHDLRLIAKLRDLSIAEDAMKGEVARFAVSVCDAAERGDTAAQNITKLEAEDLADSAAVALRRLFTTQKLKSGVTVVQCGGLLTNRFYRSLLRRSST